MRPSSAWATARYALAWVVPLLVVAFAASQLLGETRRDLERAARTAGCVLRSDTPPRENLSDVSVPPTFGPPARPARPGLHRESPPRSALVGALRRGLTIVQYRPGTSADDIAALRALVRRDLDMTILTPDATGMPYAVAATAWRHLLACSRVDPATLDALEAFRDDHGGRVPSDED